MRRIDTRTASAPEMSDSHCLVHCPTPISDHSTSKSWRLSLTPISRKTKQVITRQGMKSPGQIQSVLTSGMQMCTLKSLCLTSLHGIGTHPEVQRIYLQQNLLPSFEGWEPQPDLVELNMEDNKIENFRCVYNVKYVKYERLSDSCIHLNGILKSLLLLRGACEQKFLENLRLQGNPVACCRHYRTMAIIAFGKQGLHNVLRVIDGVAVKRSELEVASSLSKVFISSVSAFELI